MLRIILGIGLGGAVGFAVGYIGKCASGTCPLTGNPWVSTIVGMLIGLMLARG